MSVDERKRNEDLLWMDCVIQIIERFDNWVVEKKYVSLPEIKAFYFAVSIEGRDLVSIKTLLSPGSILEDVLGEIGFPMPYVEMSGKEFFFNRGES